MPPLLPALVVILLVAAPAWAEEVRQRADTDIFDFDQPFDEAINKHVLRSWLNRALDAMEDHIEVTGKLRKEDQGEPREGRLELRLYPQGKSRSNEHIGAEGFFRFSPDAGDNEFTLRFKSSKASPRTTPDPADFL